MTLKTSEVVLKERVSDRRDIRNMNSLFSSFLAFTPPHGTFALISRGELGVAGIEGCHVQNGQNLYG